MAHELDDRLRGVETKMASLTTAIEIQLDTTTKIIERHDRTLFHTEKGVVVRLDREEQKSKNITRVVWIILTGAIGMGMTFAATAMF